MDKEKQTFAFTKENYKWLIIGIVVIAIGYILMIGGGSEDPNVFNPEIFSTQRITVSPIVLLIGFGIVIYSIMKKSKD